MYFLKSLNSPNCVGIYVGSTNNIERRVKEYNDGLSISTKHYRPLTLGTFIAVKTESKVKELEKYFKLVREKQF